MQNASRPTITVGGTHRSLTHTHLRSNGIRPEELFVPSFAGTGVHRSPALESRSAKNPELYQLFAHLNHRYGIVSDASQNPQHQLSLLEPRSTMKMEIPFEFMSSDGMSNVGTPDPTNTKQDEYVGSFSAATVQRFGSDQDSSQNNPTTATTPGLRGTPRRASRPKGAHRRPPTPPATTGDKYRRTALQEEGDGSSSRYRGGSGSNSAIVKPGPHPLPVQSYRSIRDGTPTKRKGGKASRISATSTKQTTHHKKVFSVSTTRDIKRHVYDDNSLLAKFHRDTDLMAERVVQTRKATLQVNAQAQNYGAKQLSLHTHVVRSSDHNKRSVVADVQAKANVKESQPLLTEEELIMFTRQCVDDHNSRTDEGENAESFPYDAVIAEHEASNDRSGAALIRQRELIPTEIVKALPPAHEIPELDQHYYDYYSLPDRAMSLEELLAVQPLQHGDGARLRHMLAADEENEVAGLASSSASVRTEEELIQVDEFQQVLQEQAAVPADAAEAQTSSIITQIVSVHDSPVVVGFNEENESLLGISIKTSVDSKSEAPVISATPTEAPTAALAPEQPSGATTSQHRDKNNSAHGWNRSIRHDERNYQNASLAVGESSVFSVTDNPVSAVTNISPGMQVVVNPHYENRTDTEL